MRNNDYKGFMGAMIPLVGVWAMLLGLIMITAISIDTIQETSAIELQASVKEEIIEEEIKEEKAIKPIAEDVYKTEIKQCKIKNADGLNIRLEKDMESSIEGVIYPDEIFDVEVIYKNDEVDTSEKWFKLSKSGMFVCSEYIEILDKKIDIKDYVLTSKGTYIKELPKVISRKVTVPSNLSVDDMKKITKGTNLESTSEAIISVEKEYGINSFFTYAVAALESSYGNSNIARDRNNLFGMNAVDANPNLAFGYDSKASSIKDFGKRIHKYYTSAGRTSIDSINDKYSSDKEWHNKVYGIMQTALEKVN